MVRRGICPVCNNGPKKLVYCHPESREKICPTCYFRITGKSLPVKIGICSECGNGPKKTTYNHPDPEKEGNICHNCHSKFKRLEKRLGTPVKSLPVKVARLTVKRSEKRRPKYPDRKSVIKALEARIREGKENYLNKLALEDMTLYRAVHKFEVDLPRKRDASKPSRLAKTPVIVSSSTPAPITKEKEENSKEPKQGCRTDESTHQESGL